MVWLKECPRCKNGDLYLDEDGCRNCMQCGYVQYPAEAAAGAIERARLQLGLPSTAVLELEWAPA